MTINIKTFEDAVNDKDTIIVMISKNLGWMNVTDSFRKMLKLTQDINKEVSKK